MKKHGFTLVEFLIVMAIITLIIAIGYGSVSKGGNIDVNSEAYAQMFPDASRALSQRKLVEQNERLIAQQDELIRLKKLEMERGR